jgi:hypothetical protein
MSLIQPDKILGPHPKPDGFGCYTQAEDTNTNSEVPHRALSQDSDNRDKTVEQLREALIHHHTSDEMRKRDLRIQKSLLKLGFPASGGHSHRFPCADKTRKGNLAEVFLAEYIVAESNASLPVYRLRYNPNVDQSMKGDDVLAFDFSSDPVRILICEAKFRSSPSKQSVEDIIAGLIRSHKAGLPASLQFVADRLFESGNSDLGSSVAECALLMASGKLDLQYVGMLLSDTKSKQYVDQYTNYDLRNLVMVSLGIDDPNGLVEQSFNKIEECDDDDSD